MSKMSQLHAELEEQAVELGYRSLEEAMENGYEVICDGTTIGDTMVVKLVKSADEQEEAHEAWLEEKEKVLSILNCIRDEIIDAMGDKNCISIEDVDRVIDFIEKGEV